MYFTHKFTDPEVKKIGVIQNTEEMLFTYFWGQMQLRYPAFTGMTLHEISDTKGIIKQWVGDNFANANLTTVADFVSRLIDDYIENNVDREADRGE